MESTRIHIVVPHDLLTRVDGARGDVPRSTFVRRAVEAALSGGVTVKMSPDPVERQKVRQATVPEGQRSKAEAPSAPSRAPAEYMGCERHPEAGATQGPNGKWWCAWGNCTKPARRRDA